MTLQEAYALLEVTDSTPLQQVKRSYRRAARLYHPDAVSGLSDTDKFHQIVTAYNMITKRAPADSPSSGPRKKDKTGGKRQWTPWRWGAARPGAEPCEGGETEKAGGKAKARDNGKGAAGRDMPWLLTYDELVIRFDRSPSVWVRIEAAHAIYNYYRERFEHFAIRRLPSSNPKIQADLIQMLGRIGTESALKAIAPYLTSRNRDLCCAAFLALDRMGDRGHSIIDRQLNTPSVMVYHLTGLFSRGELEKKVLKARLVSSERMRRLNAVARRTGAPLRDLLEGIGISLPQSA